MSVTVTEYRVVVERNPLFGEVTMRFSDIETAKMSGPVRSGLSVVEKRTVTTTEWEPLE